MGRYDNMYFFAIYRDGVHLGNVMEYSPKRAIKLYLKNEFAVTKKFLSHFEAVFAVEGIHYKMTKEEKRTARFLLREKNRTRQDSRQ